MDRHLVQPSVTDADRDWVLAGAEMTLFLAGAGIWPLWDIGRGRIYGKKR